MDTRPVAEAELVRGVESGAGVVCVDMRDVQFCGSSGLNMLLTVRFRAQEAHVPFVLVAPSARVMRVLEVTGAADLFLVYPHYELAVDDLAGR